MSLFYDRVDAGIELAYTLRDYHDSQAVVYALPRGGVIIGAQIAKILHLPLDLLISRKIGAPGNPEYAIAAVTEYGPVVSNQVVVDKLDPLWFFRQVEEARRECARRRLLYAHNQLSPKLSHRTAIVVDNGVATGITLMAALAEVRRYRPHDIVVAVPVINYWVAKEVEKFCDKLVALHIADDAEIPVGYYYDDFSQVTDFEVLHYLASVKEEVV